MMNPKYVLVNMIEERLNILKNFYNINTVHEYEDLIRKKEI